MLVDVFEGGRVDEGYDVLWLDFGQGLVALYLVLLVEAQTVEPSKVGSD